MSTRVSVRATYMHMSCSKLSNCDSFGHEVVGTSSRCLATSWHPGDRDLVGSHWTLGSTSKLLSSEVPMKSARVFETLGRKLLHSWWRKLVSRCWKSQVHQFFVFIQASIGQTKHSCSRWHRCWRGSGSAGLGWLWHWGLILGSLDRLSLLLR